jgi:hypothetical protein
MAREKIVTLYDTKAHADAAVANLVNAGFSAADISEAGQGSLPTDLSTNDPRLWRRLFGRDFSDADTASFANLIADGGVILTVRADSDSVPRALAILNQHDLVVADRTNLVAEEAEVIPVAPVREDLGKEGVLKLLKENIAVGKRLEETGAERIRRYTVTKPVSAEVTLHDEHAEVFHRAVEDANYLDADWDDAVVEIRESTEVPVVTKAARVYDEVGIRNVGTDRVETVTDTVREQHFEVEQVPVAEERVVSGRVVGQADEVLAHRAVDAYGNVVTAGKAWA